MVNDIFIQSWPLPSSKGMLTGTLPKGVMACHLPSGISVVCDAFRYPHQNRTEALARLQALVLASGRAI